MARRPATPLPPDRPVPLTIYLRHRQRVRRRPGSKADLDELTERTTLAQLEEERRRVLDKPLRRLRRIATLLGATAFHIDYLRRSASLIATPAIIESVFRTVLVSVDGNGDSIRYPRRKPRPPRGWSEVSHAVLGLDTRPLPPSPPLAPHANPAPGAGLLPSQIARLYGVPSTRSATAQVIGVIAPAGGYLQSDMDTACVAMSVPSPTLIDIPVGPGSNAMGADPQGDEELTLDLQVIAGAAPGARIVVYFAERTEAGLVAGLAEAVYGKTERPTVVVMTWGMAEDLWTDQSRLAMDAVLQDAVRLGITVVATAGDHLSGDNISDGVLHVTYPAASPYVLACGGTEVKLDDSRAAIAEEVVWRDDNFSGTGGGISRRYSPPAFQANVALPLSADLQRAGRGVPDIAAAASKRNGYRIVLRGNTVTKSGTSAAAPLWAGLIALLNTQRASSLGYLNSALYAAPAALRDIVHGHNRDSLTGLGYASGPGWDACTGLGAPDFVALSAALGQ